MSAAPRPVSGEAEPLVDLVIEAEGWRAALPDLEAVATRAARLALDAAGHPPDAWQIVLLACDNARITELNARFRGHEAPTDVLSWPAIAPPVPRPAPEDVAAGPRQHLGDVALALETTAEDAAARSLGLKDHATHLILHGCLHLLGFDHETEAEAGVMEDLERRALALVGLPDPYRRGPAATPGSDE